MIMVVRSLNYSPESDDDAAAGAQSPPQAPSALFLRPRPALQLVLDPPLLARAVPLAARPPCARAESARTRGEHPPAAAEPPPPPSRQQQLAALGLPVCSRGGRGDAGPGSLAAVFSAFAAGEPPAAPASWETPTVAPGPAALSPW